ncbi:response regulator transcription factor [Thalassolituus sp.]|jgi:DNA-binding response OmpR family regulator|uniref:response regulator transcription factor n=1 Tax=Thalassolituus sp. TaxID=2030822 RepID=UPI002A81A44B|nr:response regulator transcription factor [Thalassolituus sp.]
MRLLVVEDDPMLGESLVTTLRNMSYVVDWVKDGQHALNALIKEDFDLAIMDIGLPIIDGIQIIKELRARGSELPILILTARDSLHDRVTGLDAGADDYLLKPFELDELTARVRALLRRRKVRSESALVFDLVRLEPNSHQVFYKGEEVSLSRREYTLLEIFMTRPKQVFTRQQLEQAIYGWSEDVGSNALEVHVHHLRKKFYPELIRTIRGIGYTLIESSKASNDD